MNFMVSIEVLLGYIDKVKNLQYMDFQRLLLEAKDASERLLLESIMLIMDRDKLIAKLKMIKEVYGIDRVVLINNESELVKERTYIVGSKYRKVTFSLGNSDIMLYERPDFKTNGVNEVRSMSIDPYIVEEGDYLTGEKTRVLYMRDLNLELWNLPVKEDKILKDIEQERLHLFRMIVEELYFFKGNVQVRVKNPNESYSTSYSTFRSDGQILDENGNSLNSDTRYTKVLVDNANYVVVASKDLSSISLVVKEEFLKEIYDLNDCGLTQMLNSILNKDLLRR